MLDAASLESALVSVLVKPQMSSAAVLQEENLHQWLSLSTLNVQPCHYPLKLLNEEGTDSQVTRRPQTQPRAQHRCEARRSFLRSRTPP